MRAEPGKLQYSAWFPHPKEKIFEFFSDAYNLSILTPDWIHFEILTPRPVPMFVGALIEYKLRIRGIPVRWTTEIKEWNPPHGFLDVQLKGPYKVWEHRHVFMEENGGTRMLDEVRYAAPGGKLVERLLVRPDVQRIFKYRADKMHQLFGTR